MYVRELLVQYRLRPVSESDLPIHRPFATSRDAAGLLTTLLGAEAVEVCGVLCLSTKHTVLAYHELSRGTIDSTTVHPRDVFRTALLAHAPCVIIGHNHPSGDAKPSPDDVALTRRLLDAARIVGVDLADHIVVSAEGQYFSFREAGLISS